jgi:NADH:ubiquinone oxidoreductase subunit 6 (subunit J)
MPINFARKREIPEWRRLLEWYIFGATFTGVLGALGIIVGMILITVEADNNTVDIDDARVLPPIVFTPYLFLYPLAPAVLAGAVIGMIAWLLERRWGVRPAE